MTTTPSSTTKPRSPVTTAMTVAVGGRAKLTEVSGLEFVASLVRSLAWPAAVIALGLVFRTTLTTALSGHLTRLKAGPGGLELEWEFAASVVAERVGHPAQSATADERQRELAQQAHIAPDTVMQRSYDDIERALRDLTLPVDPGAAHRYGAHGVAGIAHQHGLISDATLNAVEGLSVMRTLAMLGDETRVTPERALEFATLADAVLFAIRQDATNRHRPGP